MRRIKVMLAIVAAVATMMVMAAPAMAQTSCCGDVFFPNVGSSDGVRAFGVSNVDDGFLFGDEDFEVPVLVDRGFGFFTVCQAEFDEGFLEDVDC